MTPRCSLSQRLIKLPPIFEEERWIKPRAQFPVGADFVGGVINGKLVLWGGTQKELNGKLNYLPTNVVYTYTPGQSGDKTDKWESITVVGYEHPGKARAGFTVLNDLIYLIGGYDYKRGAITFNDISTLSVDGKFTRLPKPTVEDVPLLPRAQAEAWSYNDSVYFFGGQIYHEDYSTSNGLAFNFIDKTYKFNTLTNKTTLLLTKGDFHNKTDQLRFECLNI